MMDTEKLLEKNMPECNSVCKKYAGTGNSGSQAVPKAVILWAGCGRRISSAYGGIHKAMIPLNGEPLLAHLLRTLYYAGLKEIVPVLGYRGEVMLPAIESYGGMFDAIYPVINDDFDKTNNLASLLCAEPIVHSEDFIIINGDMVFDAGILKDMVKTGGNLIASDLGSYPCQLDSPRLLIENGRILDIGRHRTIDESQGYAVGIYRFSAEFSDECFSLGKKLLLSDPQAGYHDILLSCLDRVEFRACPVCGREWMDVDEPADVPKAEAMLRRLSHV